MNGPEPEVGDEVVTEDEISIGDLVVLRKRYDGKIGIHRISREDADLHTEPLFIVKPGSSATSIKISPFQEMDP